MCDTCNKRGLGWRGWTPAPEPAFLTATGPWQDLSHPIGPDLPRAHVFDKPVVERIKSLPQDPLNVTRLDMVVHTGTHVDAPRHFFNDGPAFDEIPLHRLHGPGLVCRLDKPPDSLIGIDDFAPYAERLRPGDIVALDTGWAVHAGTAYYDERHPCLSVDVAEWLVAQGVKLVACDFPTPDLPLARRPPGFDWPVHHVLLSAGVLVCEHLKAHPDLAGRRAEFAFCALSILGSDGAPARVLARTIADE